VSELAQASTGWPIDIDGRFIVPGTDAPLVSSGYGSVGDYTNPILQPWAAEAVRKHGEVELSGVGLPRPNDQCWPEPVPYIFWNVGMQLLQQPDRVTIIYYDHNQVRRVRMNEPHPVKVTPSWYGDSVGHYEGDTLVVDTVRVKTDRLLPVIDWYDTPYTQALHVVERYRLIDYESTRNALQHAQKELLRFPANNDTRLVIDPTCCISNSRSRMKAPSRPLGRRR
jgi:hypothetical protein